MKNSLLKLFLGIFLFSFFSGWSQIEPISMGHGEHSIANSECITLEQRRSIESILEHNRDSLNMDQRSNSSLVSSFGWPLKAADGFSEYGYHGISNFVDHDPASGSLEDFNCGTRSYDLSNYDHQGTDFFTWPFSWYKMDYDQVEVIACEEGIIIGRFDGNFDRQCGFGGGSWNAVYIEHPDGSIAWYGHLKEGSLTPKQIGDPISKGEYLGVVGSSGNSTGPHLHLEIYDASGLLIDPFDGSCNPTTASSWWDDQIDYYDSAINQISTHSAPPVWGDCPDQEITNEKNNFCGGDVVYLMSFYRDQLEGQTSLHSIILPDNSVLYDWESSSTVDFYAASWWYWSVNLPDDPQEGIWKYQILYEGVTYTHEFHVGEPEPSEVFIEVFDNLFVIVYDAEDGGADETIWTMGDGTEPFNASGNFGYDYPGPGEYQACVTMTNSCGTWGDCFDISYTEGCLDGDAFNFNPTANVDGTCSYCLGDYDGDGMVGSSDLLTFLSSFGCSPNCFPDMNGDGTVGAADLLDFLSVFGEICGD